MTICQYMAEILFLARLFIEGLKKGGIMFYFDFHEPYQIKETKEGYNLTYEMPGFDRKEIHVGVENYILEINAKSEEFDRSVVRKFKLPNDIDVKSIEVSLRNGMLTVFIPKKNNKNRLVFEIK